MKTSYISTINSIFKKRFVNSDLKTYHKDELTWIVPTIFKKEFINNNKFFYIHQGSTIDYYLGICFNLKIRKRYRKEFFSESIAVHYMSSLTSDTINYMTILFSEFSHKALVKKKNKRYVTYCALSTHKKLYLL